ncbi:MAG: TolC family outer membrane protein [Alphaproteobacteria bacterium]
MFTFRRILLSTVRGAVVSAAAIGLSGQAAWAQNQPPKPTPAKTQVNNTNKPRPPVQTEMLEDALAKAYATNPQIESARAKLRATDEQFPQALSNFRPTVELQANLGYEWQRSRTEIDNTPVYNRGENMPRGYSVQVNQPIFRGGRTIAQIRQANNNISAERARLVTTEQSVLLAGVVAYMNVVRDMALVRLNVSNQQVLRANLQATRDRFNVGEVTRTDVAQSEAQLARATAARVQAEGNLEVSRANYQNIVGELPPGNLTSPRRVLELPKTRAELVEIARTNNPNVIAALFGELSTRNQVDLIAGELLPSITVTGSVGRSYDSSFRGQRSDAASIVATLTMPLYEAGSITSRLRAAKQQVGQARYDLAQSRRAVIENAIRAWEVLVSARAQVVAFTQEVRANRIALEGVRQENRAGLRTVLDVLNAEQTLLNSNVNLVNAQRDREVAQYDLWSALGWLTAQQLGLKVALYDPKKHYNDVKWKPWGLGDPLPPAPEKPKR